MACSWDDLRVTKWATTFSESKVAVAVITTARSGGWPLNPDDKTMRLLLLLAGAWLLVVMAAFPSGPRTAGAFAMGAWRRDGVTYVRHDGACFVRRPELRWRRMLGGITRLR
jgi:hypothetical protein